MADPKNTAPNDPGASTVRAMAEGAGPLGLADAIDQRLTAAGAIVDLARVLAALERTPEPPRREGQMMTGEGYADGVRTRDDSMPAALFHAMELIDDAQQLSVRLGNLTRKAGSQA